MSKIVIPYEIGNSVRTAPPRRSLYWNPSQWLAENRVSRILAFFAVHVLLALVLMQSRYLFAAHAWLTLGVGLWWAASGKQLERVAYIGAYITGAEVFWRMTQAPIFWEFGKYALSAVFLVALVRSQLLKGPILAFAYFALLLPSIILPLANMETAKLQDQLSFNLSGPFSMMVSIWFFSHVRMAMPQLQRLFITFIAPLISIVTLIMTGIISTKQLVFTGESNFTTSGGFGPNQVSAVLGLGGLFALLYVLKGRVKAAERAVMIGTLFVCAAYSALTFSRTGLYCAAGGTIVAGFYLLKDSRALLKLMGLMAVFLLVASFLLLPQLDSFTGGRLAARFRDTGMTGRDSLMLDDLQVWSEHPIFGVGPGLSRNFHTFHHAASHTEFSRLLAEHGTFGFAALLCLLMLAWANIRRAGDPKGRALTAGMTVWSFMFMVATAMRLVAPAFAFGLGGLTLIDIEEENNPASAPMLTPARQQLPPNHYSNSRQAPVRNRER